MNDSDLRQKVSAAVEYQKDNLIRYLQEIVAIPSFSSEEKEVAERVKQEMRRLKYDEVRIDSFGNVIGRVGNGHQKILYDTHLDTVGIGDPSAWEYDPFKGKFENGTLYGRGTSDNKGAGACMVYSGAIAKELGLLEEVSLYVVGSVQEEPCEGLAYQTIITEDGLRPDCVLLGECTGLRIYRGQRGRIEMKVVTKGVSCHGSAPERGENAIYKMTEIIKKIEQLNGQLKDDAFLGSGTIAVTKIECQTASINAIPDECTIYVDRRLTRGETKETALKEIEEIVNGEAKVEIRHLEGRSYTGKSLSIEKYYPTWFLEENHPAIQSAVTAYRAIFAKNPEVGRWTFSTNGVYTMGIENIPTLGLGPSDEHYTHSVNDQVAVDDLIKATIFYVVFPRFFSLHSTLEP
ncbi:MAG: YgeY family selenium metabolism-linked hydrolase [bacterium]